MGELGRIKTLLCAFFLDAEKDFDRTGYIPKILERFEVGTFFMKWLDLIYKDQKAILIMNGHKTKRLPLVRG